ncbi:MAG: hypothetical protein HYU65_09110, partial [Armatimonadetes bacterium]|nr:hypothetical protein [Armatimonadota bacterium]
ALLSGLLVYVFRADTHALIPLYAVGVFLSFTLSQSGMVKRWWTRRGPGWLRNLLINGLGAATTAVVLAVVVVTKFVHGAWIVLLLIPANVWIMYRIYAHYHRVREQLTLEGARAPDPIHKHKVVVPVGGMHRGVLQALRYAKSLGGDAVAVTVDVDPSRTKDIESKWERWGLGIPLKVLPSPYRSVLEPLLRYLNDLEWEIGFDQQITVVLPEFVPLRWWHFFLHGQSAFLLKLALFFRRRQGYRVTVVTDVPYYLTGDEPAAAVVPAPRPLAVPILLAATAAAGTGGAFAVSLAREWPPIVTEVLGIAFVLALAAMSFLLLVRAVVSGR